MQPQDTTSRGSVQLACEQCGTHFTRWAAEYRRRNRGKRTYCSNACKHQGSRLSFAPSGVYAIVHLPSGRVYVGSTADTVRRWNSHRSHLQRGIHDNPGLQATWTADGPAAFEFRILEAVDERARLVPREQFWLDTLQAAHPNHGFNRDPTAGSSLGRKATPEQRARAMGRGKGRVATAESRQRMAASARGRPRSGANLRANNYFRSLPDTAVVAIKQALLSDAHPWIVAEQHSVSRVTIAQIARGITYTHVMTETAAELRAAYYIAIGRLVNHDAALTEDTVL